MSRFLPPPPHNAECVMCHHGYAAIEYCDEHHIPGAQPSGERRRYLSTEQFGVSGDSHFHRICRHCGYEWTEPVA